MNPLFQTVVAVLDGPATGIAAALEVLVARAGVERVLLVHLADADDVVGRVLAARLRVETLGVHASGDREIVDIVRREDADLLVATPERGRPLLRTAECPTLLVPGNAAFGSAVVGMDFSDGAFAALRVASRLCASVRAVAVVDVAGEGVSEAEVRAGVERAWEERGSPGAALEVVASAHPADALQAAAARADLLVVGSRGLTPLAAAVLGSTAERLAATSEHALLVVRPKGAHTSLFGALFH